MNKVKDTVHFCKAKLTFILDSLSTYVGTMFIDISNIKLYFITCTITTAAAAAAAAATGAAAAGSYPPHSGNIEGKEKPWDGT